MKCKECCQDVPTPSFLDATGREFTVCSTLLYMREVYKIDLNGVMVSSDKPLSVRPVIIRLDTINIEPEHNKYIMRGLEFHPRYIAIDEYEIHGTPGEINPHVYKLTDDFGDIVS